MTPYPQFPDDFPEDPEDAMSAVPAVPVVDTPELVACLNPLHTARTAPTAEDFRRAHWLLRRLGNRWTFPILEALHHGPMRFARLKRALDPVSQRMLTLSLRRLERDELVFRHEIPGQPPQVTYGLSPLGEALVERLADFNCWLAANRRMLAKRDPN